MFRRSHTKPQSRTLQENREGGSGAYERHCHHQGMYCSEEHVSNKKLANEGDMCQVELNPKRVNKCDPEKELFPRPNTRKTKSELDGAKLFGYVGTYCVDFATSCCKSIISSLLPMKCMFREGMSTKPKVVLTRNSRYETTNILITSKQELAIFLVLTDEICVLRNQ